MTSPAPKQTSNEPDSHKMLGSLQIKEAGESVAASVWAGRHQGPLPSGSGPPISEHVASCPPTGFVKSQEGENEEGSEGELVVKFGETLPKVIRGRDVPRQDSQPPGWQCQAVAEPRPGLSRGRGQPRARCGRGRRGPPACRARSQGDVWPTFQ